MKRELKHSRILLTGASSGIGYALAGELASQGASLLLLARRKERLEKLVEEIGQNSKSKSEQAKIVFLAGDITEPDVQKKAIETMVCEFGGLDLLINNAGVGATCSVEATSQETVRRLMDVNYFAAFSLTQLAIPLLRQSAQSEQQKHWGVRPMIVFLSSVVGLRGVPHFGAYGAAKFAVAGLSESLRAELAADGIDVLLVSPGTTRTEFFDALLESKTVPNLPQHYSVSSESVAKKIVRAMRKGQRRLIPYFPAKILNGLNRLSPSLTDGIMTRYQ